MEFLWVVICIAIAVVCYYKSKEEPLTEQERLDIEDLLDKRETSPMMKTTEREDNPYNGVPSKEKM